MRKMAGFKLTFEFYKRLFIGIVLGFGADYIFNYTGEWRLRIFIFGVSIIVVFFCYKTIRKIKYNYYQKQAVNELSNEECEYVLRCNKGEEYFSIEDTSDYCSFETKWNYILSIPHGKMIEMYVPYRIKTDRRAVRLIKKRLKRYIVLKNGRKN